MQMEDMRMTNLFKEGLYIKSKDGTEIKIPINAKVSLIRGNSATGKTKMIKFIADILAAKEIAECNIDIEDIKVVRDTLEFDLLKASKEFTNKVIFIDKFDMTDFNESIPFIEASNNFFIICAHRNLPKCGWCKESILELNHTKKLYELTELDYGW